MLQHEQENHTTPPTPTEPEVSEKSSQWPTRSRLRPSAGSHAVQSGQIGNPHGRSAGRPNTKTTIARVISETVPVREGDKTRQMTKLEAMLQAHTMKAMKGDARSASIVIRLVTRMGLLGEFETETLAVLSEEDQAILADYVRRHTSSTKCDSERFGETIMSASALILKQDFTQAGALDQLCDETLSPLSERYSAP